ncbi:hypothetical protein ACM6Q7_06930 [Peribacillus butanolivorans]|uniref:hypothetical protein n=1 Tax=Peribacillus butanolivorans TaxID=421767 RepID=UPI0039FCF042
MNKKEEKNLYIKKKIMFNKEQDFNFVAYNNLLILTAFKCFSEEKRWQDYRKLIYLYPYVADSSLLELLRRAIANTPLHPFDKEILRETYTKSFLKTSMVKLLLLNLERNDKISFSKNKSKPTLDVWINVEKLPGNFLNQQVFEAEYGNLERIKTIFPRLRTMSLKTILEKVYEENGVNIWEV